MRMIDGDALKDRLQALSYDDWNQGVSTTWANAYAECADMVGDMPTIEPERKKGKWIKHSIGHEHTPWGFDCSECGEWLVVGEEIVKKYNYCPNCGADMRGEQP